MGPLHRINSCCSYIADSASRPANRKGVADSVFFHEDNYCLLEIIPVQNLLTRRPDGTNVNNGYAEKDFTGHGFLSCSGQTDMPWPIKNLGIDKIEFKAVVQRQSLYYFDTVYTGYSTQRILKKNTRGFGFENYVLFYEFDQGIVTRCWLDYNPIRNELNTYPEKLQTVLFKVGTIYDLVLVDWNECQTVNLANKHALMSYVQHEL